MAENLVLTAQDLHCRRGGRTIFRDLSFGLYAGEALIVTGRNGAGKSSLLRMLAGLLRIESGSLALSGGNAENSVAEQAHYLGHSDALKPALTVLENLSFWTAYLDGRGEPRTALATVGLETLRGLPAGYLSAGQRRRLSIARLVSVQRPLWLLDEPTSALDTAAQAMLLDLMRAHLRDGGMIVAATHLSLGLEGAQELKLERAA